MRARSGRAVRFALWLAMLVIVPGSAASRPAGAQLAAGDTLRLLTPTTEAVRGTYVGADARSIYLRPLATTDTVRVGRGDYMRVERFMGRERLGARAVKMGIGTGVVLGLAGGVVSTSMHPGKGDAGGIAGNLAAGALLGGIAGLAVGELVSGRKVERWRTVEPWRDAGPRVVASTPTAADSARFQPALVRVTTPRVASIAGLRDTVRLFAGGSELVRGVLVDTAASELVVAPFDATEVVRIPVARIDHALVRRGDRKRGGSAVMAGTLIGLGVGATLVTLTAVAPGNDPEGEGLAIVLSVAAAGATTVLGMLAGAIASQTYVDVWLPFDPATRVVSLSGFAP
jgi:hypothetical protein